MRSSMLIIILAMTLSACVPSGKVRMVDDTRKDFKLSQQQGVVVARVINASAYPQTFNYLTVSPKNVYDKKENKFERITAIKKLAGKTTVFASPLPAGEYSLSDLYSYHFFQTYYYQLFANAGLKFGTFKIEPGKITNLGTLIYYQKPDGDKYLPLVVRKNEFNDALEYLEGEKPELLKQVDPSGMLSWDEDDYDTERHNLYLNVVQNPVTFDIAYPQEDGSWYFPCKLGILLQRTARGEWNIDALETDYDLMLFNQNSKGDKVIVDERGDIYFKDRKAKSWSGIPHPDTDDEIGYAQLGNSGDIYLISFSDTKLKVYSGKVSATPEWNIILSYTPSQGWKSSGEIESATSGKGKKTRQVHRKSTIKSFSAVMAQGKTLVAVDKNLYELNLSPGRGTATRMPVDFDLTAMERSAYNQLSISRSSMWDGSTIRQYSLDNGATWHTFEDTYDRCPESKKKKTNYCDDKKPYRLSRRDHITTPVFFADGKGYSIMEETYSEGSFFTRIEWKKRYEFVVSHDRGITWVKSPGSELPKYCGSLRKGPDDKTLLLSCENATGQFYKADRDTLNWEIDYQPALF